MHKPGYVYLLTNQHHTVLYMGVTGDLEKRIWQHKNKQAKGFAQRYNCDKLVWFEQAIEIESAIAREKQIKAGSRQNKEKLIAGMNPDWADLAADWYEEF